MKLRPSVMVMAVVTTVPFGLAVRDEVRARDGGDLGASGYEADEADEADEGDEGDEGEDGEAPEEEEAARAEARALTQARDALLPTLFGEAPASLGPGLLGLDLGQPLDSFQRGMQRQEALLEKLQLGLVPALAGETVAALDVDLWSGLAPLARDTEAARCDALRDELRATWGPPAALPPGMSWVWRDPATGRRAVLSAEGSCGVRIEASAEVAAWITPKDQAALIPLWAIGKRADDLVAAIRPEHQHALERTADAIFLEVPGVGEGYGPTMVSAWFADGKIHSLMAWTQASVRTAEDVAARLDATLGRHTTPAEDEDARTWRFGRTHTLSLYHVGGKLQLAVRPTGAP